MKGFKKAIALLLTLCLVIQPMTAFAATADVPKDGTTSGAPFVKGTAGSNSFRIPSLVTLSDGTLVTAADARWNTTYDGGGLDTIVSTSTDDGATWNYTFANYLGDNENEYNGSSTCFIDPAMAVTSDDTIYMLVDLYPYGVALNGSKETTPDTTKGFDDQGRLLLSGNNHTSYGYYLENGKIYNTSGTEQSGYTVDSHFNITGNGVDSNLFFKDSPFKVVRTGFLYLTKSTDKGKTWSAPTLLNLKTTSEQVCLVGPGRGLVTSEGMIVFPCYSYHGDNAPASNTQRLSFIYSADGTNWSRTSEFNYNWASEAAVVELNDGTLRFFYRNGTTNLCYVDYNVTTNTWGSAVNTGLDTNSNCQISAITYSKTVSGQQVILVSCPTGPNEAGSNSSSASDRLNGKIFVGLVNSDNTISWQTDETIDVASKNSTNSFMYSCLTELKDGKIAILYEDNESNWGTGTDSYYQMSYATYDFPMTADTGNTGDSSGSGDSSGGETEGDIDVTITNTVDVTLAVGETSQLYTDSTGNYESTATINDNTVATMAVTGTDESDDVIEALTSLTAGADNKFYIQVSEGTYLTVDGGTTTNLAEAELWYANAAYNTYCTIRSSSNGYYLGVNDGSVYTSQYTLYMKMSNGVLVGYYSGDPAGTPVRATAGSTKSTEVKFTGVKPGTTTAVVGSTQYNITVNKNTASAAVAVGGTTTFSNAGTTIVSNTNSGAATATLSNGVLTINAVATGTTTITTDYGVYTITVSDGTPVTIKENETDELSVELTDGQYVEWSTADSNYVGVAGKYDSDASAYTDSAVIIGHNVTESPVVVTGTIYNADGTKVGIQKWLVTVTAGDADTNTTNKHIYVNVTAIENCTVYYAVNGGELVKINGTGILVDEDITGHYNIMFFAAPDEGYALTYMSVSGSGNQYYTLSNGNPDGTGSGAWPFDSATQTTIPTSSNDSAWVDGHGFRWSLLEGNMTIEQMKLMFSTAIDLGCDGATTFTKNSNDGFYTEVQFAAQKLPTLEKKIVSITRGGTGKTETYSEEMKVAIGDKINYEIYITEYAEEEGNIYDKASSYTVTSPITNTNKPTYATGSYGTITYSEESLVDKLTNASWSPDLGTSSTTESTHTYSTSVTLTTDNFKTIVKDGIITNTADLAYDYTSNYSTGTLNATSSAAAEITVDIPSYVIDFGLPVTFDLSELALVKGKINSASATYGNVAVSEDKITYTPTTTLKGVDYIKLELEDGHYAIAVYPATTVYYEEGFATGSKGDWKTFSIASSLKQLAEEVGAKINVYGFDSAYTGVGASNGTQATSDEASIGTVNFTGTGVDIYTNNTSDSGVLMAWVKNSAGNTVKVIQVDTHMESGDNSYTSGQDVNAYNVPVVSITGLERGSYTVELRHIGQSVKNDDGTSSVVYKPVALDGYRVHGTIDPATDAYVKDKEDNPTFIEVRDKVLAGLNVSVDEGIYAEDIAEDTLAQVYATAQSTEGAVVLSSYGGTGTANVDIQDLLDNGPKNELYLRSGESIVFKVNTKRVTQIGLKALNEAVTDVSIKANGVAITGAPTSISTSTDMFYKLADEKTDAAEVTYTITNNAGGVLSITELKICDDPNAAFGELEADDLIPALGTLGYKTESSEPAPGPDVPVEPGTPETPVVPEEPGTPDEPTQEPEHECAMTEEITPATTMKAGKIVIKCKECGEVESTKIIYKASNVKLGQATFVYNGKQKNPKVIVKDSKGNVINAKYYKVIKLTGRTNVGKYTYTIKFNGRYQGTKKLTLTVKPKATAIKTVTPSKKAFTVKWNKVSKQATGYEIMYAKNAKFSKGKHTVTVKNFKTTSKKISNLKAKQKYYVKVRSYKTVKVNGKMTKIYSNWSKYRTVTTKR